MSSERRFIPYSRQEVSAEDIAAVTAVLQSDFLTQGPVTPQFEHAFAQRHGAAHALAVANATAGLHMACLAFGVGPGSLVWTSPNSFLASANCALYCGADIDFVDIDPATRNMGLAALAAKLEQAKQRGRLPDVVIPVDFAGLPCDLREMRGLADRYGFRIVEDASHATGAAYEGQPVGSRHADITVFSLHAVKIITAGEGGMLTTADAEIAERLRLLRSHGMVRDAGQFTGAQQGGWVYEQQLLGFNYRMTEIQAALGLSQLQRLDALQARRQQMADRYDRLLADLPLILPARVPRRTSAWHLYVVEIDGSRTPVARAEVFDRMRAAGIGVHVHYIPIHTQPFYRARGFSAGDFPLAERYYQRALTLPLHPGLTQDDQQYVVDSLRSALAG
ncbi:UDP-4-amino-4,6-dideoxy-N-acetyl-beta-L-altrosamine transaminase [Ramlibacter sp.]|uniref:UDP-4-amino-4, 6-dideoxy-N-acetyl-beta-L-altrosamine transaminase n=1 Tax=Ramlibacter sp. TaxID=1917967 RepID=UPI00262B59D9|nr:UDP-4-amino-4,6-dideoxy-N-acetyl-beta-L-altrosamine transaminase [Ramlibacter sp.]MDB5958286.1 UDP-4-amino-4,6-dideoxy-N-acetyl-beta-L-altrosamine transaminase [Ramlibacter sp.]